MRYLVTGANGFIGSAMCAELVGRGESVVGSVRMACDLPLGADMIVVPKVDSRTDWTKALKNVGIVVHLAGRTQKDRVGRSVVSDEFYEVNSLGTERLARMAAAHGVKRFLFVSTIGVNGARSIPGVPFSETSVPTPIGDYAISKWDAEKSLMEVSHETGMEIVIIRPPLVYGATAKGKFKDLVKIVSAGWPLPLGEINNLRSFISVNNLVDFLCICSSHPRAANELFLVSDGSDVSTTDFVRNIASTLGIHPYLLPVPKRLFYAIANLIGKRDEMSGILADLQVDISKARGVLGWKPPVSLEEGVRLALSKRRNG